MNWLEVVLKPIFGSKQDRDIKRLRPAVELINAIEPAMTLAEDAQLQIWARELREWAGREDKQGALELAAKIAEKGLAAFNADALELANERLRARARRTVEEIQKQFGDHPMARVLAASLKPEKIDAMIAGTADALERLKAENPDIVFLIGEFRGRFAGEGSDPLNPLLPLAFALTREAARRVLGQRHFDVQLMGGIVLHEGKISEMRTGEGKTLVATLPCFLNGLTGKGVHMITVNDFLATRDCTWMGRVYEFLGLRAGLILGDMPVGLRRAAYDADITFGTNSEFGFDYLRDNMALFAEHCVQRGHAYAIVDEVDSILIDEARTPLIISGPAEASTEIYDVMDRAAAELKAGEDFELDEKHRSVSISETGIERASDIMIKRGIIRTGNLYEPHNIYLAHYLLQSLRARNLYQRDVEYVVQEGRIIIVDEFTGRLMDGRRWSEGLHQAVEAKERVKVERENQTLATITIQNYFRMYAKLAGMTGTADTEAAEFHKIYNLEVVVVPTHRPMVRDDQDDMIYRTKKEKFDAITQLVEEIHKNGAPALVGTISIEVSELLSQMFKKRGIPHQVLNAKYHEKEAYIVAEAGKRGAVTIATNMAGRGTDIVLGEGVPDAGGLHIIGSERHESRRIDNQLRGRAGRQGDPGMSRFYVSLEDDLMRLFGSERISSIMQRLGMEEGEPIYHPWVTKALMRAQSKVEAMHFDIRKHLLEYDDVMNRQREIIYRERNNALRNASIREYIIDLLQDRLESAVLEHTDPKLPAQEWDVEGLRTRLRQLFVEPLLEGAPSHATQEDTYDGLWAEVERRYGERETAIGAERLRDVEKMVVLQVLDKFWKEHLYSLDYLQQGINLRAVGQKDPLVEFKRESFQMFDVMLENMKTEMVGLLFRIGPESGESASPTRRPPLAPESAAPRLTYGRSFVTPLAGAGRSTPDGGFHVIESMPHEQTRKPTPPLRSEKPVGRNDPCPCGSGKKYKKCHGAGK